MSPSSGHVLSKSLPGADLVAQGMEDLQRGLETEPALLVLVAGPRLRRLGVVVPELPVSRPFEHRLYARIEERLGNAAHSYYNSLLRRIVSYARALERERAQDLSAQSLSPKPLND